MSRTRLILISTAIFLCLCTFTSRAQKYDRGYDNSHQTVFAPKGTFMVGGNARYSFHTMSNYRFLVVDGINSRGYTVSATPNFLYMVRDNMGVGLSLSYGRTLLDLASADLSVSEISMGVRDYYLLTQSFGGPATFRPYIPLGTSGRFSMFAQVGLGFSLGRVKNTAQVESQVKGSFTKQNKILIGVNPGFSAFITNHLAMELSIGVLGFNYRWTDQSHNQVASGSSSNSNASFSLNLASIAVGFAYYL